MSDGVTTPEADDQPKLSAETQAVLDQAQAHLENPTDPLAIKPVPAPAGVPEKFWDPVEGKLRTDDLVKAYGELEKKLGAPKDGADPADPEGDPKDPEGDPKDPEADLNEDEPKDPADEPALAAAIDGAAKAYAETGELSAEAREPLLKAGISNEQIDLYMAGVKAAENALEAAVTEPFGSREAYDEAVAWAAAGGFTKKQAEAFNAQTVDVETAKLAGKMLFDAYKAANPGEGRLTNINTGISRGDVYETMGDFQEDLRKADALGDRNARSKALAKLQRSRQAKSIK